VTDSRSAKKQRQAAGANSQQIQITGDFIQVGVSELRAREIAEESAFRIVQEFQVEARASARGRIESVVRKLIPELSTEGLLPALADPAYCSFLEGAQRTAACLADEGYQDLLTSMLVERARQDTPRIRLALARAVEVIDKLSADSLAALSRVWFLENLCPDSPSISTALELFEQLAKDIFRDSEAPTNSSWKSDLDILDCIRLVPAKLAQLVSFDEILSHKFPLFLGGGIPFGEEDELQAELRAFGLSPELNESMLHPGHFVLRYGREEWLARDLAADTSVANPNATASELVALARQRNIHSDALKKLGEIVSSYPALAGLRRFWDSIQGAVEVTVVGSAIALSSARRWVPLADIGTLGEVLDSHNE